MQVELLDHTRCPEDVIANAAATCYGTDRSPGANKKRIEHLMRVGHHSPLRFAYATFRISGVSRVESHQHVRVAHAGVLQRSQRYTQATKSIVRPPSFSKASNASKDAITIAENAAIEAYELLLKDGVPMEDARYILPQASTTEFVMTGNFQMWNDWIKNRNNPQAQWEIREVAMRIHAMLSGIAPNIFPPVIR